MKSCCRSYIQQSIFSNCVCVCVCVCVCSPFQTHILPQFDASRVRVTGDGVKPQGVLASIPVSFTIDTRDAGIADLDVSIQVCD